MACQDFLELGCSQSLFSPDPPSFAPSSRSVTAAPRAEGAPGELCSLPYSAGRPPGQSSVQLTASELRFSERLN